MADPVTLDFSGRLEDGGSVSGWFTYDNTAPNRTPGSNVPTFNLTSWAIDVLPGTAGIQQFTFRNVNSETGRVAQFPLGPGAYTRLEFSNRNFPPPFLRILLNFSPILDPTLTTPPVGIQEFGEFLPTTSRYQVYDLPGPAGNDIVRLQVQSGALTSSPIPEPSTKLLMGSGLIGLIGWRWWSAKKTA